MTEHTPEYACTPFGMIPGEKFPNKKIENKTKLTQDLCAMCIDQGRCLNIDQDDCPKT
jgi:hypothetical protein